MRANPGISGPARRRRSESGYSLVEVIVSIGVAALVGAAIYAVMNSQQRHGLSQRIYNELQTNCNFALDQMKGELLLAGYRATDRVRPIINADANTVTFEYWDDNARNEAPFSTGYTNGTRVKFSVNADGELIREFTRYQGAAWDETNVTSQKLAGHIAALNFEYLSGDNSPWTSGDRKDIKSIRTRLTCNASRPNPNTGKTAQITLTAEIRARNIDVASSPSDVTKPATPGGLIAWDPGHCGKLELRWNANTEADLGGYTLYYGVAPGDYSERVVIPAAPKNPGDKQSHTMTGLQSAVTGMLAPPRYYFALAAYDNSGNVSVPLSGEASGNPSPNNARTVAEVSTYGIDSTINPDPPPTPTLFASDTSVAGSVKLTWSKSTVPGLVGYRLYRSKQGQDGTFVPDDTAGTGNQVADESVLDKDRTDWVDTTTIGCTQYWYKLAAIACDTNLPAASLNYANVSAYPDETAAPPAPTLTARPGYKRIILTLNNPDITTVKDFSYTKVFYADSRTHTSHPSLIAAVNPAPGAPRTVLNAATGAPIPDNNVGIYVPSPQDNWGKYVGSSTSTINFNNYTDGSIGNTLPLLVPCLNADWQTPGADCTPITYFFTAVSYDKCGNSSSITAASITEARQCSDGISPDATWGAATWSLTKGQYSYPDNANIIGAGCSDYIDLTWDEINSEVVDDLAGYHVFRCEGYACPAGTGERLTLGGPVWYPTFHDAVTNGKVYSYRIEATDCFYEVGQSLGLSGWQNNYSYDTIEALSVGGLSGDTTMPKAVTGYLLPNTPTLPFTVSAANGLTSVPPSFLHNTVTFWMQNIAANTATLQQYSSSWANNLAYLNTFAFGDGATTPVSVGWQEPIPATPSQPNTGSTVMMQANSRLLASDAKIPVVLNFKNADGSVSRDTDARQQAINYTLTYTNDATATPGCIISGTIPVPLGPYLYGVVQDQPATGTVAWPRPGDQGTNAMNVIVAPGGQNVTVFANVYPATATSVAAAKLYYYVDTARTLTAMPAVSPTAQYPTLPPYTAVNLAYVAGFQWRTPVGQGIPATEDANVWYFIVAVDNQGNFDRSPEIGGGAYQYYQQSVDVCAAKPDPPTLTGSTDGMNVRLTWTPPTSNEDDSLYLDGQGFKVYRDDGTGWILLGNGTILDKNATSYNDPAVPNLETLAYRYYVTAFDTCSPTPRESAPSNFYNETAENPCSSPPSPPALRGTTDVSSVTLTWTAPTTNASGSELTDLAGYELRRGVGTTWTTLKSFPVGTLTYTDTVLSDLETVDYTYYVTAFDSCGTGAMSSAPSNLYTDQSIPNDGSNCNTIPNGVTKLRITSTDATGVTLSWVNPTTSWEGSPPSPKPYNDAGKIWIRRGLTFDPESPSSNWITELAPQDTSWKDTDPTIGQYVYHYWVMPEDTCSWQPQDSMGNTLWPPPVTEQYTDPCLEKPGTPTGLNVTSATFAGVNLAWAAPAGAGDIAGYVIERRTGTSGEWAQVTGSPTNGPESTFTDAVGDANMQDYFYRVQAFDTCSPTPLYGEFTEAVPEDLLFNPCNPLPFAPTWSLPTPLMATPSSTCPGTSGGSVALSWPAAKAAANPGANIQYLVYRCDSGQSNNACTLVSDNQSSTPSFFTSTGAVSSKAKLLTSTPLPTGTLTYNDLPGTPLSGNKIKISYLVRAVNMSCSTQTPKPFLNSIIVTPCP